jgi:ectoine hydroxylase-related dioxygenase (phytanoyl-CoA dioxygenase family)
MISDTLASRYARDGYAVVRGFMPAADVVALSAVVDAVEAAALAHGRSFRHGNLNYRLGADGGVRMAQWACWHFPELDALRTDPRYLALLGPMIGADLKQIIQQIPWKPRGQGSGGDFAWHQDSRFRRPRSAYRNLATSYVQTGLALDPHTLASGCLQVIPGSHRAGDLAVAADGQVLGKAVSDDDLLAAGLDPAAKVELLLEPGDLALWSPFLVHASGENRAGHARRLLINGYVTAADCDRGEWAFRNGAPVPLPPTPSLVHFEGLSDRPEPHYP